MIRNKMLWPGAFILAAFMSAASCLPAPRPGKPSPVATTVAITVGTVGEAIATPSRAGLPGSKLEPGVRAVPVDMQEALRIQKAVDEGHTPGRRDPLDVAYTYLDKEFGLPLGEARLASQQDYSAAKVEVEKNGYILLLTLEKIRRDRTGAWFVTEIEIR